MEESSSSRQRGRLRHRALPTERSFSSPAALTRIHYPEPTHLLSAIRVMSHALQSNQGSHVGGVRIQQIHPLHAESLNIKQDLEGVATSSTNRGRVLRNPSVGDTPVTSIMHELEATRNLLEMTGHDLDAVIAYIQNKDCPQATSAIRTVMRRLAGFWWLLCFRHICRLIRCRHRHLWEIHDWLEFFGFIHCLLSFVLCVGAWSLLALNSPYGSVEGGLLLKWSSLTLYLGSLLLVLISIRSFYEQCLVLRCRHRCKKLLHGQELLQNSAWCLFLFCIFIGVLWLCYISS